MAVQLSNLTSGPLGVPTPFNIVLQNKESKQFDSVLYASAINFTNIRELINSGYISVVNLDVGTGGAITDGQIPDAITRDSELSTHSTSTSNPHTVTAAQAGALPTTDKGAANGVAELDGSSLVPYAQLPNDWKAGAASGTWSGAGPYTLAVVFSNAFPSVNYAVALTADAAGGAVYDLKVTSKAVGGFTLVAEVDPGASAVNWTAHLYRDA